VPQATLLVPSRQKVSSQQPAQVPHVEAGLQNPATQRPEQGWQGPVVPQKVESCCESGTQRPKSQQPSQALQVGASATDKRVSHATSISRPSHHPRMRLGYHTMRAAAFWYAPRVARLLLLVVVAGCGSTVRPPPVPCGPQSCTGCCTRDDTCVKGDGDSQCGTGGATCLDCAPDRRCLAQSCQVEPLPAGAKLAFLTRTTFKGNLGGLAGADALCNAAAQAGRLPGRFKAWLSTNEWNSQRSVAVYVHAVDRFIGNGPWYLLGVDAMGRRQLVFANRAAMRAAPLVAISKNELGQDLSTGRFVFTGTEATGLSRTVGSFQSPQGTCDNWTGQSGAGLVGSVFGSGGDWTAAADQSCGNDYSLYCFED